MATGPEAGDRVRPATEADLPAVAAIFEASERAGDPAPTVAFADPSLFRHDLIASDLAVAESERGLVGFGSCLPRDRTRFLSNLFVLPGHRDSGAGRRILEAVMPDDGRLRCTLSSTDPRAQALYARAGMAPGGRTWSWREEATNRSRARRVRSGRSGPGRCRAGRTGCRVLGTAEAAGPGHAGSRPGRRFVLDPACRCNGGVRVRPAALPGVPLGQGFRITYVELFHSSGGDLADPTRYAVATSGLF